MSKYKTQLEEARLSWSNIAKQNGWYKEPFFVIIWIDNDGIVQNSVSHRGLNRDVIMDYHTEEVIENVTNN